MAQPMTQAHPSDSLLPCPVCGKPGQRNGRGKAGGVVCAQRTHRLQAYGSSQVEAEEVWNTRAPLSAAPGGEGEPFMYAYECVDDGRWQAYRQQLKRADGSVCPGKALYEHPAPPEPVAWRSGDEAPVVERGGVKSFVVAVFRAHSGQNYTFAAEYLNAMELDWEEDNDTRMATKTGWFLEIGEDQDFYRPVTLGKGDKFLGWTDLPRWPDAPVALTAPSPKGGE